MRRDIKRAGSNLISAVKPFSLAIGIVFAGPANAHVFFESDTVSVDNLFFARLLVPSEGEKCAAGTSTVAITLPKQAALEMPRVKAGWSLSKVESADGTTIVTWTGGNIPAGSYDVFEFVAIIDAPEGTKLVFPATQTCGGKSYVWKDVAPKGVMFEADALPAPTLTVISGPKNLA